MLCVFVVEYQTNAAAWRPEQHKLAEEDSEINDCLTLGPYQLV